VETSPLETSHGIPSTAIIGRHFSLGKLGLGEFTPSKSDRVEVLKYFIFYKIRGKIVNQSDKRLKLLGVPKLTVTTRTTLMDDTRGDPIVTTSTVVSFS